METINEIKRQWEEFYNEFKDKNVSETDIKLSFINKYIKLIYGGDMTKCFGFIGGNTPDEGAYLFIGMCKYTYDQSIALINDIKWILRPIGKNSIMPLTDKQDHTIDVITGLADIVGLKLAYCSYKQGDGARERFKKLGFKRTNLKTDKDCFIMLRNPKSIE